MRRELHRDNKSVYFTFSFVGIALMAAIIIGVAVLRRRSARLPQNQVQSAHISVLDSLNGL